MARGVMTTAVQETAIKMLGKELNKVEVRLMPYIMVNLMDNTPLNRSSLNHEDREVLKDWENRGWITKEGADVKVSAEFYLAMTTILMFSYCSEYIFDYEAVAPKMLQKLMEK